MVWYLNDKPVTDEHVEGYSSFVYLITNKMSGRKYLGKKTFTFARSKPIRGSTRKRRLRVASDWQKYYGSNKDLCEDVRIHGPENFHREILRLCTTKSEASYWEAKYQFQYDVLMSDQWYNSWISVKVHKNKSLGG